MGHVTLIRPPVLVPSLSSLSSAVPPLGLAYVAGTIRARGHHVALIDAPGEAIDQHRPCSSDPRLLEHGLSNSQVVERIPAHTDVIGISCMFSVEWFHVIELIRSIRARFPSQPIILGGEHASADHEYILKSTPEVDACILGEGENKLLGLVDAWLSGVPKHELPGAAVLDRESGQVRKNPERDGSYRIHDVDSIPRPAWDLLPLSAYLDAGVGYGTVKSRAMPMLASRGCPYRCTFCSSPQMWTTRWKARDVEDLIDEIKTYVRNYRVNKILFYDLTVVIDKKWIVRFCERLIEEDLRISWAMPSGSRTEGLTREVLQLMKRSGCSFVVYPIETGNPRVAEIVGKKLNYKHSLSSMRSAVRAGMYVKINMIIGFPFQTFGDILREYLFVIRAAWIGGSDLMFHMFSPYPGSELHNQLVSEGRIVKDAQYPVFLKTLTLNNYVDSRSWNPRFSARTMRIFGLVGMMEFYFLQFLFRPQRLFISAYRLLVQRPVTILELMLACAIPRLLRVGRVRTFGEQSESMT